MMRNCFQNEVKEKDSLIGRFDKMDTSMSHTAKRHIGMKTAAEYSPFSL